ncbi:MULTISPECIES: HAD hydrolase-like protein [Lacticaseibacillus]|uniref:HAD family hydrolase n=3 Tax=Lacticaseibacillus zeae TaxID=57037 RepID=A0A5R8M399_LACZE|nr:MULTISPECIES: HAD hydrolase-like protein [Lacticaseibacillus]OFR95732.1 haloacid dehalogenase [Lactobacillus sp. HMSC068F07]KRK13639.1 P-Ser-HPr phosphatase [Lacticaseibacillus zeae DSM 20178 = KCTC 3804]MDE3282480.1 HAD hydrolase-like protein [Lacticaseibacillus casei]MDE3315248.1 HAD hydrolase-like protein [Lacticaseibacillus zeae]OLS08922.1 haloacid dehalogenase [Lacticaseibacillus casei]
MLVNAIWDFDGTLYDSYPGMMKALRSLVLDNGGQIETDALYRQVKKTSIKKFLTDFGSKVGRSVDELEADYHHRARAYLHDIHPYPAALPVLQAIKDQGGNNLLLTHRDHSAWQILANDHADTLFLGGVDSDLNLPRKPAPDAIQYLLDRFQLNPAVTAMIGDRSLDIDAGVNAGVKTIYFNVDGLNAAPQADFKVDTLEEIPPLFRK